MKLERSLDHDFAGTIEKVTSRDRPGRLVAGFWVAVGLYSPFALVPAGLDSRADWWPGWFLMWPILPGFAPGALLAHPHDTAIFVVAAFTTLGLVSALTFLGAAGRGRLGLAIALAFVVSIPTAILVQACIAF